jgi:hypothetical protein
MDNSNVICPVSSRLNYLKLAGHNSGSLFSVSRGNSRYSILFQSTFKTAITGSWLEFKLLQMTSVIQQMEIQCFSTLHKIVQFLILRRVTVEVNMACSTVC